MHNAHVVEVFDSIQDLLNELTGIFLCVEALLYDTIKEFPTRHSVYEKNSERGTKNRREAWKFKSVKARYKKIIPANSSK